MAARALILDLDGTVWDSQPWLCELLGGEDEAARVEVERALRELVPAARLVKKADLSAAKFGQLCRSSRTLRLYAEVRSTLDEIRRRGTPLAVVTNLPRWMAEPMLECADLGEYFEVIASFDRRGKVRRIASVREELSLRDRDGIWYVGDTETDFRAAIEAGVSFAWASYGYGESCPAGCETTIAQFSEVLRL